MRINCLLNFCDQRLGPWVVLGFSLAALASAFIAQYGFGLAPCELCLLQRWPFGTAAVVALLATSMPLQPYVRLLLGACAVLLFINAGIAVFHSGVERHWWEWQSSCTGSALSRTHSLEDLRRELLEKPVVRCDQISWSIFGLSMANVNVAFSFALGLFAACAAIRPASASRRD